MESEGLDASGAMRFLQNHTLRTVETSQIPPESCSIVLPPGYKLLNSLDKFPSYAISRGITPEVADEFKIGMTRLGRYAWHLIFPVMQNYKLSGFVARRMSNDGSRRYLYPKGFKTSEVLYRIDELTGDNCVIVEGVFDCIPLQSEAVALLGSFLSKVHLKLLLDKGFKKICLALDPDAKEKTKRFGNKLLAYFGKVEVVELPGGDPGSYSREQLLDLLADAVGFREWEFKYYKSTIENMVH